MLALEYAGVDNWTFYDEAISNYREENGISTDKILSLEDKLFALQIGGVRNWIYYEDAIEEYIKEYKISK